jgi:hypothetical protein
MAKTTNLGVRSSNLFGRAIVRFCAISPPRPAGGDRMPHFVAQLCRRSSAARPRRRWLLSRREDALTSAASLGDLRAVARSRVLHGLGLCRRKILTHILGTARGIEGCLGVALELRHHLARD